MSETRTKTINIHDEPRGCHSVVSSTAMTREFKLGIRKMRSRFECHFFPSLSLSFGKCVLSEWSEGLVVSQAGGHGGDERWRCERRVTGVPRMAAAHSSATAHLVGIPRPRRARKQTVQKRQWLRILYVPKSSISVLIRFVCPALKWWVRLLLFLKDFIAPASADIF